jgi:hypothetical protein
MTQSTIEANELVCRNRELGWHDDPGHTFPCDLIATQTFIHRQIVHG